MFFFHLACDACENTPDGALRRTASIESQVYADGISPASSQEHDCWRVPVFLDHCLRPRGQANSRNNGLEGRFMEQRDVARLQCSINLHCKPMTTERVEIDSWEKIIFLVVCLHHDHSSCHDCHTKPT